LKCGCCFGSKCDFAYASPCPFSGLGFAHQRQRRGSRSSTDRKCKRLSAHGFLASPTSPNRPSIHSLFSVARRPDRRAGRDAGPGG
jgi:hypothetical protein